MKTLLKILAVLIVMLLLVVILVPYFYKDKLVQYFKSELNNTLNARVDFEDVDLSLIKNFPNFNLGINNLSIKGINEFEGVELLKLEQLGLVLNLKSVLTDEPIKINKFKAENGIVDIRVTSKGLANYDITKTSEDKETKQEDPTTFNLKLKSYEFNNLDLSYNDDSMNFQTFIKGFNHSGSGDFSDTAFVLKTHSTADTLSVKYANIPYLNKVKLDLKSDLDIENNYSKYTFKNTKALINNLPLKADGFIALLKNAVDIDLSFETENANIVNLMSLIPKVYLPDLKDIKTNGVAKIIGHVRGQNTEKSLPGFNLNMLVQNGTIQYPDLPEKVDNINLLTNVDFKGGEDLNTMQIDISKCHFDIAGSQVDSHLSLKNIMKNPFITAKFKSDVNFEDVKKAIKYDNINTLRGELNADLYVAGAMSDISQQQIDRIKADGFLNLKHFVFESSNYQLPIEILNALVQLTPSHLNVETFTANVGKNDFDVTGSVNNYLAFALGKADVLKGTVNVKSKATNINDFMTEEEKTKTQPQQVVKIPDNIDMTVNLQADHVTYKTFDLKQVQGQLVLADASAKIHNTTMNMMGGTVRLDGLYNSKGNKPTSNINVKLDKMGIKESAASFDMFSTYAPILNNITGQFNSDINLDINFDEHMNPVLESINALGVFKTDEISAQGVDILNKISGLLKLDDLSSPKLSKINASFKINDGKLSILPHNFKVNGMNAGLSGTFDINKVMNLELSLDVPRSKLGDNLNNVLNQITSGLDKLNLKQEDLGQEIKTKFLITGNVTNPKIKPLLFGSNTGETVVETAKEMVKDKVAQVSNKALTKAKAEADKLIQLAQEQKTKLVAEAQKLADETRSQADKAAKELLEKAGDNPLKQLAVQTAVDKLKQEADKKATKIVTLAEQKGDALIQKARNEADSLMIKASGK